MPDCPRCGCEGREYTGRVWVGNDDRLDHTHECTNENCKSLFKYVAPEAWVKKFGRELVSTEG